MSTSDSLDEDELAASLRKRAYPAAKAMSSQVVQLTSTLKVPYSNNFWMHLVLFSQTASNSAFSSSVL